MDWKKKLISLYKNIWKVKIKYRLKNSKEI